MHVLPWPPPPRVRADAHLVFLLDVRAHVTTGFVTLDSLQPFTSRGLPVHSPQSTT